MLDLKDKVIFVEDYHDKVKPYFYSVIDIAENEICLRSFYSDAIIKVPLHQIAITYHENFSFIRDKSLLDKFMYVLAIPGIGYSNMSWLRHLVDMIAEGLFLNSNDISLNASNAMNENPNCCEEIKRSANLIERVESGDWHGLKKSGWAMRFHLYDGAEYVIVNFCPFCGKLLPGLKQQSERTKENH